MPGLEGGIRKSSSVEERSKECGERAHKWKPSPLVKWKTGKEGREKKDGGGGRYSFGIRWSAALKSKLLQIACISEGRKRLLPVKATIESQLPCITLRNNSQVEQIKTIQ